MRERRTFAERTKVFSSDMTRRKYYLVFEGAETEAIYFDAVSAMGSDIGISPLIELIPIIRSYSEEGWSNPKKILDRIIENLEESRTKHISYETLLNRIMDYFFEERVISSSRVQAKGIWDAMRRICAEKCLQEITSDVEDIGESCRVILETLQENYELPHVISDISGIITEGGFTYAEGFDKICFIIDRDRKSFVSSPQNNQYKYVVEKCKQMGFGLYVTNPCFEFWLLLHFDQVFELDRDLLLENPRITAKRRYVEQELHKLCPGYKKCSYRAEELVKQIDKAVNNEREFCEDVEDLENAVGSNIGRLIVDMRS